MPKNIVICADGTGNSTIKGRGTNVFKLYEAVDENGHRFSPVIEQVAIYHDGVGTESLKWIRIFSGATGWGLSRNVKQLYGELARVYDPGDRIFLFGFSRGAFTVRTLGGLITTCGILDLSRYSTNAAFDAAIDKAYAEYRRKYQTLVSRLLRGKRTLDVAALRQRFSVAIPAFSDPAQHLIRFIGVWDTVDAVGLPLRIADVINRLFYAFKFPDATLSDKVKHACHALALDETRHSFAPVLWDECAPQDDERIEQVWFAGVHSNVGGGYPRQGMSLVALDWMMTQAEAHGLRFIPAERQLYRDSTDVDDKLYDSRAGLGVFYRWKPRNAETLCHQHKVRPKVHRTVFQRIARNTDGYAPGSVPSNPEVVTTSASASVTEHIRKLVATHHAEQGALVARMPRWLLAGRVAYALLLVTTLLFVGIMLYTDYADARQSHEGRALLLALANSVVSSNWLGIAARTVWHHPWLMVLAIASLIVGLRVDHHLDAVYSEFWHDLRLHLREALQGSSAPANLETGPRFRPERLADASDAQRNTGRPPRGGRSKKSPG